MSHNILHIGSNNMHEIDESYTKKYKKGIFIEPIPHIFIDLSNNLLSVNNKYNTNYICFNDLITNTNNKLYDFNIYKNLKGGDLGPSSIYKEGKNWPYHNRIPIIKTIPLYSTRMSTFINKNNIDTSYLNNTVIDVQGAELEVLKSFDDYINHIKHLRIEISQKEYYSGQALFTEVHNFLISKGFILSSKKIPIHGDIFYSRK